MTARSFFITLVLSLFCAIQSLPSFSETLADRFAISPSATWSGSKTNGTTRSIIGVLPSDFKEDSEIVTSSGSYSNRVMVRGMNVRQYRVSIRLDGDLISGSKTIPASNLKYMLTYTNGIGTKSNYQKYVDFSASWNTVYLSDPSEAPFPEADTAERELQLKYAIQVPQDQPPGTYTANIEYLGEELGAAGVTVSRTTPISVTVGNYFRLSVDRGSIDFEKMKPGETKDNTPAEGIIVTSKTNVGNPWYLKISDDSPLSSGPFLIPNSNFFWYGWTDGAGTWYGNGNNYMTLIPELMYASGPNETNNLPNGTNNHLKFKLAIPNGQPGGKYISSVKLTMTE